jgi:hypothetical protein
MISKKTHKNYNIILTISLGLIILLFLLGIYIYNQKPDISKNITTTPNIINPNKNIVSKDNIDKLSNIILPIIDKSINDKYSNSILPDRNENLQENYKNIAICGSKKMLNIYNEINGDTNELFNIKTYDDFAKICTKIFKHDNSLLFCNNDKQLVAIDSIFTNIDKVVLHINEIIDYVKKYIIFDNSIIESDYINPSTNTLTKKYENKYGYDFTEKEVEYIKNYNFSILNTISDALTNFYKNFYLNDSNFYNFLNDNLNKNFIYQGNCVAKILIDKNTVDGNISSETVDKIVNDIMENNIGYPNDFKDCQENQLTALIYMYNKNINVKDNLELLNIVFKIIDFGKYKELTSEQKNILDNTKN